MEQIAPFVGFALLLLGTMQYIQSLLKKNENTVDKSQERENELQAKINSLTEHNIELRLENQALGQREIFYKNQYKIYKAAYIGFLRGKNHKGEISAEARLSTNDVSFEVEFDTKPLPPLPDTLTDLNEP